MGHRALVAVERADGRYDCYRSQWGADDHRLRTVLGSDATVSVGFLLDALGGVESVARAATAKGVLGLLDPLTDEALLVFDGTRTVYLVVALHVVTAAADGNTGRAPPAALVPVTDVETAGRIRRFVRTVSSVLGDAVDVGLVSPAMAEGYLRARLYSHPDVPAETLRIGGDLLG